MSARNACALGLLAMAVLLYACHDQPAGAPGVAPIDYSLAATNVHSSFSRDHDAALTVPSGSVVEVFTHEATGGQFALGSDEQDLANLDFSRVHAMTGPIHVEGAEPGDVLSVELLEIDVGEWGWMALTPQFGFLADEIQSTSMHTYAIDRRDGTVRFADNIVLPLKPFPGIMGVAPPGDEALNTFPPRANGGNMDNPAFTVGTAVHFPVFVDGALFSIGDTHALQGFGEVSATALEAPMRIVLRLTVNKNGRALSEPQYETDQYYATTGFGTTIDEAARKATRYMIEYLMAEKGLARDDAYRLCSLAGDLHIAQVVDLPHMLVAMHLPKQIFVR